MVLTFLASLSSKTLLAEYQSSRATFELQERQAVSRDAVAFVMDLALGAQTPAHLELPGSPNVRIDLVDVGGLIDLKTAHSALSAKVMEHLDLSPDQQRKFRNWRRNPGTEEDLSAFLRVIDGTPDQLEPLSQLATLRSGRPGISPLHAPREVLEMITGTGEEHDKLTKPVPDAFTSQPRRTLVQVWVNRDDARWLAGEVRLARNHSSAAWLWAP
ncbi:hypothetical protein KUV51_18110 [Tateyamaria omphalii]|uniref:hypothetical protein n=1 Tax=Tateyamaria omphalii TaxID=299262 RepID=UPI001C9936B3|nr:hypothetical protein [Tateyamaria omphalii]MBY5934923.1 hypothetical protein [Tateyamaria omphalii]